MLNGHSRSGATRISFTLLEGDQSLQIEGGRSQGILQCAHGQKVKESLGLVQENDVVTGPYFNEVSPIKVVSAQLRRNTNAGLRPLPLDSTVQSFVLTQSSPSVSYYHEGGHVPPTAAIGCANVRNGSNAAIRQPRRERLLFAPGA